MCDPPAVARVIFADASIADFSSLQKAFDCAVLMSDSSELQVRAGGEDSAETLWEADAGYGLVNVGRELGLDLRYCK